MNRIKAQLFRSAAFRISLLYACVYSLLSAAGLSVIYWSTASHIEDQINARLRLETNILLDHYRRRALPALVETIRERSREDGRRKLFFYLLQSPQSQPLAGRLRVWPQGLDSTYATLRLSDLFQIGQESDDVRVRVLATALPGGYRLLVGRDLNDAEALLKHTLGVVLIVIAVTFLLVIPGSVLLGRYALRRINAVGSTAGDIMQGDLSQRIPITTRDDEFDQLALKLNAMLERIERLMTGMRQVTDNIAHDLRSPLNRLRSRLEVTLLEARDPDEYQAVLAQAVSDVDELLKTFNALLSIAQAEAGIQRDQWLPVDLAALVENLVELYEASAESRGIQLDYSLSGPLSIQGDRQLLAQAVSNLLDNAIKYTPAGGHIALTLGQEQGTTVLSVADSGPGIPAAQRDKVLERFVRLDSARSTLGNGLGLSLVKAVASLHGARLLLDDNCPGLKVSLCFNS